MSVQGYKVYYEEELELLESGEETAWLTKCMVRGPSVASAASVASGASVAARVRYAGMPRFILTCLAGRGLANQGDRAVPCQNTERGTCAASTHIPTSETLRHSRR